jgi:phosphoribosylformimino-5-aminoimidazole carboxamide ribonucleotide (ProFAR) isomerase
VKDCIRDLVEYAGGFLITFVEREGRLAGIDIPAIEELVAVRLFGFLRVAMY